jgi:glycosyltransferase 2 family protein
MGSSPKRTEGEAAGASSTGAPVRARKPSARRRFLVTSARLGLALGLLSILFSRVAWRDLVEAFASLAWWWIPLLLGIRILALFVQSQRWRLFLADQRIRASSARLFKSYWIARFFNNFLPGQLGGDAYRVLYGLDPGVSRAQVASSVVAERLAGLIGLMSIAAAGGWASFQMMRASGLGLLPIAATATAIALLVIAIRPTLATSLAGLAQALPVSRLSQLLARLANALLAHVGQRATLVAGIALSAVFYALLAFENYLALRAFGVEIELTSVLVVAPTIALIMSVPVTINGWGTAEAASVLLYTQLGVAETDALSMALLTRLNFLLMGGMGGLLYLWQSWHSPARADHLA